MQKHVHAGEVVGRVVLFLPEDFANAIRTHLLPHVEQQGAGTAGKIENLVQSRFFAGGGFLAVEGDDGGEDVKKLLRDVELPRLLPGARSELADQVFIGIAQRVGVG